MLKAKIYRKESLFVKFPKELQSDIKRKIGSTWVSDTKDVLRGLSKEEEKEYLPDIIGIQPTSEQWNGAVRDYWLNYVIDVPKEGKELIIGVDEDGKPLNVPDYIAYNFASKHVSVASTKEQLMNKEAFPYYMVNSADEDAAVQSAYEIGVRADKAFTSLVEKGKEDKARWVYDIVRDRENPINPDQQEMMIMLKQIKDKNPQRFVAAMLDKNLETRYLINQFIRAGVLVKEGNTYFNGDQSLGIESELIAFLEMPTNQDAKLKLMKRLEAQAV